MKIVLKEPGFENYTGQFGVNTFVNGVSVEDVSPHDAVRIGAVMRAVWEDGRTPTAATEYSALVEQTAPVLADPRTVADGPAPVAPVVAEVPPSVVYTEEALGEIADKEGIAGVRKVADTFGVKAHSINDLIEKILKKQAELAPTAKE